MSSLLPLWAQNRRKKWKYRGNQRPDMAIEPQQGQESVWDYPRPPKLVSANRLVHVEFADVILAQTTEAIKVLETSNPPGYYVPKKDVFTEYLYRNSYKSRCEWKGIAVHWDIKINELNILRSAWSYPDPFPDYEELEDFVSFYPQRVDCFVRGKQVKPQPQSGYGGWVTDEVVGPFSLPND